MYKQFSYIEPLQTSERLYKEMKTTKKFKYMRQNVNYYKEQNWINAWPRNQYFSDIPLLSNHQKKTAYYLKSKKRKKTRMEKIVKCLYHIVNKLEDSNKVKWIHITNQVNSIYNINDNKSDWRKMLEKAVYEYTRIQRPIYNLWENSQISKEVSLPTHRILYAKKIK
tara:strand:- start:264 stop:764 length:501 start_codon:yes stop_codon:yes gene_type:complete